MSKIPFNESYYKNTYGSHAVCQTCGSRRPIGELNAEAITHHNAHKLECIDRKACERRKRKAR